MQFHLKNIKSSSAMADHTLSAMTEETFLKLDSWLATKPAKLDYFELKNYILERYDGNRAGSGFIPNHPVRLVTDASDVAVGGALEQVVDGHPHPIAFFSKKLRPPERKYSVFDRELLAVYLAVRHFNSLNAKHEKSRVLLPNA